MEAQGGARLASRSVFIWVALYSVRDVFPFSAIQVSNDKYEENEDKYLATKRETEKKNYLHEKKPQNKPPPSTTNLATLSLIHFFW